jgi:hypothetical protein
MKLTTHLHLVSRLRMCGCIPLLIHKSLHVVWCLIKHKDAFTSTVPLCFQGTKQPLTPFHLNPLIMSYIILRCHCNLCLNFVYFTLCLAEICVIKVPHYLLLVMFWSVTYSDKRFLLQDLQSEGLNVTSAVVVVDREQGGRHSLSEKGVIMQSLCTLSQVMPRDLNKTVKNSRK